MLLFFLSKKLDENTSSTSISRSDIFDEILVVRYMNIKFEQFSECKKPPIVGNQTIIPIMDSRELLREQLEQENCVYSYLEVILRGEYFIYKIISEERATLGVKISPSKKCEIDQLYLKNNKIVSSKTKQLVDNWIAVNNKLIN